MSQSFITVTKTVFTTSTAVPLNSTQLESLRISREGGQIFGIAIAGVITIVGLVMLIGWLTLLTQKKSKHVATEPTAAVPRGCSSVFRVFGKKRKSQGSLGMQEMSAGSTAALMGNQGKRLSMWAEDSNTTHPYPSTAFPHQPQDRDHSRSDSRVSSNQSNESPTDLVSSSRNSTWTQQQSHAVPITSQDHGPSNDTLPTEISDRISVGYLAHTPRIAYTPNVSHGRYSFDEGGSDEHTVRPQSLEEGVEPERPAAYRWETILVRS